MIQNIKSILIGLTKEFGPDETSSALGYGLSLAQQAGAHATVQAASSKLVLPSAWTSKVASGLVHAENKRLHALAETIATGAQADAAAAGVICSTQSPHLGYISCWRCSASRRAFMTSPSLMPNLRLFILIGA